MQEGPSAAGDPPTCAVGDAEGAIRGRLTKAGGSRRCCTRRAGASLEAEEMNVFVDTAEKPSGWPRPADVPGPEPRARAARRPAPQVRTPALPLTRRLPRGEDVRPRRQLCNYVRPLATIAPVRQLEPGIRNIEISRTTTSPGSAPRPLRARRHVICRPRTTHRKRAEHRPGSHERHLVVVDQQHSWRVAGRRLEGGGRLAQIDRPVDLHGQSQHTPADRFRIQQCDRTVSFCRRCCHF